MPALSRPQKAESRSRKSDATISAASTGVVIQSAFRLATARSQLYEVCWPRVPSPKVTHYSRDLPRIRAGLFLSYRLAARGSQSGRWSLAELAFSHGRALVRGQMSLRKAVFVALICAGFVYAAFWTLYLVRGSGWAQEPTQGEARASRTLSPTDAKS